MVVFKTLTYSSLRKINPISSYLKIPLQNKRQLKDMLDPDQIGNLF